MTLKAYKYRLYPNKTQVNYLNEVFGSVRFVWNQLVANFNSYSKSGPNRLMSEKILKDNPDYHWLAEISSVALQQKRMDFDEAKNQFFCKTRKTKLGRMKFKKRGVSNESFRITGQQFTRNQIDLDLGKIKLPKMTPMKLVVDKKFTGTVRNVTVSKNKAGQYFASILVDGLINLKPSTGRSIGIDLGLSHLITLSNGMKIENPRWFRENQSKLKRGQRQLSRKTKGSSSYEKQRLKVAKLHLKVANQRKWVYQNLSTWLVNNYDTICMEDLNVAGMVKNRKLAKSISDAAWSSLVSMISYKSVWYGRTFVKVDRFYASSKTCSCCGAKVETMALSVRKWTCSSCNTVHDRDLNAATNILNQGLVDLYDFNKDELDAYKRSETSMPLVFLPKAASLRRLVSFNQI